MWKRKTRGATMPIAKKSIVFAVFITVLFWVTVCEAAFYVAANE